MVDGGVGFDVTPESATAVGDYLEGVRARILAGIREGMQEGMEGLAWKVADKLSGDPIVSRTGDLLQALIDSPRVWQNATAIGGNVSGYVPDKGDLALWLERGTSVPALTGAKGRLYQFFPPDGDSVWTHGHRAFKVASHPFMAPALQEDQGNILQLIQQKVAEAVDA